MKQGRTKKIKNVTVASGYILYWNMIAMKVTENNKYCLISSVVECWPGKTDVQGSFPWCKRSYLFSVYYLRFVSKIRNYNTELLAPVPSSARSHRTWRRCVRAAEHLLRRDYICTREVNSSMSILPILQKTSQNWFISKWVMAYNSICTAALRAVYLS